MKYMLLLRTPADGGPQDGTPELAAEMRAWGVLNKELEAVGWAAKMPCSVYGSVEIRPLSAMEQARSDAGRRRGHRRVGPRLPRRVGEGPGDADPSRRR